MRPGKSRAGPDWTRGCLDRPGGVPQADGRKMLLHRGIRAAERGSALSIAVQVSNNVAGDMVQRGSFGLCS